MFIVFLNFSNDKGRAGEFMERHKQWLKRGFDDGVLLSGSSPNRGGGILAHNTSLSDLQPGEQGPVRDRERGDGGNPRNRAVEADARLQFLLEELGGADR
jgi:hypothetical protein